MCLKLALKSIYSCFKWLLSYVIVFIIVVVAIKIYGYALKWLSAFCNFFIDHSVFCCFFFTFLGP